MLDPDILYPERIRPMSAAEYMQLAELGFYEDERIELLYGQIVEMGPRGDGHRLLAAQLLTALARQVPPPLVIQGRGGLNLWTHSVPEPDVAVVTDTLTLRRGDVYLVVEVAETSYRKDRNVKAPLYADGGIPMYWIVDATKEQIHVLSEPIEGRYRQIEVLEAGDTLVCPGLPTVEIDVAALFASD